MAANNSCFIFDVDGTLTDARQPMDAEFESFFKSWMQDKNVYLVSGSDLEKIEEQVPENILLKCKGIFSCMGNEYWKNGELVYQKKFELDDDALEWLCSQIDSSEFGYRKPPHFEFRSGSINFSVVGRGASKYLRDFYYVWDEARKERENIAKEFNKKFKKKYSVEALLGGQISLDIQKIGSDKGQVFEHLPHDATIFFGDRCYQGGNDFALAKKCNTYWQVEGWKDTQQIIQKNYA